MAISTGARCVDFVEVEDNDGSCHDYGESCDMSYECCTGLVHIPRVVCTITMFVKMNQIAVRVAP